MAILMPYNPAARSLRYTRVSSSTQLTATVGGASQLINRIGDRFRADFEMPPMDEVTAAQWISRLMQASNSTAICRLMAFYGSNVTGVPLAAGSQTGVSFTAKGFTAGAFIPEGKKLSVYAGGFYYLHILTADFTADGAGNGTLQVWPQIRATFPNNSPLYFNTPVIQGFVEQDPSWDENLCHIIGLKFSITEIR